MKQRETVAEIVAHVAAEMEKLQYAPLTIVGFVRDSKHLQDYIQEKTGENFFTEDLGRAYLKERLGFAVPGDQPLTSREAAHVRCVRRIGEYQLYGLLLRNHMAKNHPNNNWTLHDSAIISACPFGLLSACKLSSSTASQVKSSTGSGGSESASHRQTVCGSSRTEAAALLPQPQGAVNKITCRWPHADLNFSCSSVVKTMFCSIPRLPLEISPCVLQEMAGSWGKEWKKPRHHKAVIPRLLYLSEYTPQNFCAHNELTVFYHTKSFCGISPKYELGQFFQFFSSSFSPNFSLWFLSNFTKR